MKSSTSDHTLNGSKDKCNLPRATLRTYAGPRGLRASLHATRREARERAAERGGGHLARGEGAPCASVRPEMTCVAGIFPTFNLSCYITVQVMTHAFR